jgi:hypothetical protein
MYVCVCTRARPRTNRCESANSVRVSRARCKNSGPFERAGQIAAVSTLAPIIRTPPRPRSRGKGRETTTRIAVEPDVWMHLHAVPARPFRRTRRDARARSAHERQGARRRRARLWNRCLHLARGRARVAAFPGSGMLIWTEP